MSDTGYGHVPESVKPHHNKGYRGGDIEQPVKPVVIVVPWSLYHSSVRQHSREERPAVTVAALLVAAHLRSEFHAGYHLCPASRADFGFCRVRPFNWRWP